jgi:signal transduction histidine kinase
MLAREAEQGMGITVEFHRQGIEKRLDPAVELALYRIAQEALSNIARHARATHAALSISFTLTSTIMQVVDDGVGFFVPKSPSEYAPSGHFGLLGLHERAELIGATLQIQSALGKGTNLTVTLLG